VTSQARSIVEPCPIPSSMEDYMAADPLIYLRMPQRAEAVDGNEPRPDIVKPVASVPDARTVSQDSVTKAKPSLDPGDAP
jgi:hypothetical protein